jgi:glycosyltransferase involved in cell wall biosynthesis
MSTELEPPLVTVVIPTYNRLEYLKQAIYSAIHQTYRHLEIIVSDNCSPENPEALVRSFQDPRIKFWRQNQNMGMLANQLHGFKMARGKYVASLHDDDIWNQDFLTKLVPHLEANPQLILAFCDQYIIDAEGKIDPVKTRENSHAYQRDQIQPGIHQDFCKLGLVDKSIPTAAACVIRNSLIDWNLIPPEVNGMWDLYLTYLCYLSGAGIYYVPEKLTRYRTHAQTDTMLSGSRNVQAKISKAKSEIFCYQAFMEDQRLQLFHDYFRKKWLEANTTLGIGLWRNRQSSAARAYFWRTLSEEKLNLRALVGLSLSFTPFPISK